MHKYQKTLKTLVNAGYDKKKAVAAVAVAFALTEKQATELKRSIK